MKLKKLFSVLLCVALMCSCLSVFCAGASIENEKEYKPLDLVVVMDSSNSMNRSDPDKSAKAAVRMLINMMPAGDSRVGLVKFNDKAEAITTDSKGNASLVPLDEIDDVLSVKQIVTNVEYSGFTAVGNALSVATKMLEQNSDEDKAKAIILFTDGVNEFPGDSQAVRDALEAACEENEANGILWAKKNDCPVYCVAYDYTLSNGSPSLGAEGIKKLENISKSTNGTFKAINNIKDIEQLLVELLADACDLIYKPVKTIPGDGGKHEVLIDISPSVVEANIRIAGGDRDAIAKGKVQLFKPDGSEVKLQNTGNVRYDVDATAGSIKILMPAQGTWVLKVEGIKGDDIHIGLLEHFKMNLTSQLIFPEGNPAGVAYNGNKIGIKAWLTYDGQSIDNPELYNAVTKATATCVPRDKSIQEQVVNLTKDDMSFVGEFEILGECFYDITVRLEWDTVYREDTLEVRSDNKPVAFKNADGLPDVLRVNKNKTASLDNLSQYVVDEDNPNDPVTVSIASVGTPSAADVVLNGDNLSATGKKMSSTLVTIQFTDVNGNVIEDTVKVKVNDPLFWAIIILVLLAIVAAILLVPYIAYLKSLKIKGYLYLTEIEFSDGNNEYGIAETYDFTGLYGADEIESYDRALCINMRSVYRVKEKRNVSAIIEETKTLLKPFEADSTEFNARKVLTSSAAEKLMIGIDKSKLIGTPHGGAFDVKVNRRKSLYLRANRSIKKVTIGNKDNLELVFKVDNNVSDSRRDKSYLKLQYRFFTPVRLKKTNKKKY